MTKNLTLIDASGFIFRAYHSLPPLINPKGLPVGAVVGFINIMLKYLGDSKTDAVAVVFDHGRINFRHSLYPEYKANRPPAPDDLVPQFPLTREAATAMGLPVIDIEGVEADDVIATYAKLATAQGYTVTIVSSDKDLMQLITPEVKMYDAMKQKIISEAGVFEKFGVKPEKVLDVLSLIGDSSDNVPGVPGIGPKTAAELINTYGDLDNLLARAIEIKQEKRRASIIENADKAKLSRDLIRLKEDVPLTHSLDALAYKSIDKIRLVPFLQEHGFKSLLARLGAPANAPLAVENSSATTSTSPQTATNEYFLINTESQLITLIKRANEAGYIVVDCETTSLNTMNAELVGLSFSLKQGEAFYLPLGHITQGDAGDLFSSAPKLRDGQLPLKLALALLTPMFEDKSILKIGHNIKYDMEIFANYGINISPIDDTMLLSYVLHAGEHTQGMDELSELYLSHKTIKYDEVTGSGKTKKNFAEVEIDAALKYAGEDAEVTMRLWNLFKPQVAEARLQSLYQTIERPFIVVIAAMERAGILVDASQLLSLSNQFAIEMQRLEKEIIAIAGLEFNVGSPKQLGEILFERLNLPGGKKSAKTGAYGTDAEVLEELAEAGHKIAENVLEWRGMQKLKSTYTDSLPKQINAKTGRVHTSFSIASTTTGRLSSSDPNLQNIPIRTEMGKKIRSAFIAPKGKVLIGADYSQIELRLLAHIADISTLKVAFKEGRDIHAITASEMFGVNVNDISSDLRRKAKTINFGIIYGISAHGLATRLGINRSEAAEYIDRYFKQYPGIRDYMEATKEKARLHGYVETLFGRRCHVPGIADKNAARRQFYERAAINAPLQGSAADIIKRAMIAIDKEISNKKLPATMLLQVHDELVFECYETDSDNVIAKIKPLMENAAHISVPLIVEARSGSHWGEIH